MKRSTIVAATALLFLAKFFFWILSRGIYPFADQFSEGMHVSRGDFFNMLSIGELVGALAVFAGALLVAFPTGEPPAWCLMAGFRIKHTLAHPAGWLDG